MHLTEEALVLHYYGEADESGSAHLHITACEHCREEFERLGHVLALVDAQEVPEPAVRFEQEVWARLEPQLPRRAARPVARRLLGSWWAYAGGIAAMLLMAFAAGRLSRPTSTSTPAGSDAAANATERVLIVAVVDHLDQSEMVLMELMNEDVGTSTLNGDAAQLRARELVAANRLYRRSAVHAGDAAVGDVLDELERVLLELANTPGGVTAQDAQALRARIDARGLLFRVRVVHSEMRQRERQASVPGSTS